MEMHHASKMLLELFTLFHPSQLPSERTYARSHPAESAGARRFARCPHSCAAWPHTKASAGAPRRADGGVPQCGHRGGCKVWPQRGDVVTAPESPGWLQRRQQERGVQGDAPSPCPHGCTSCGRGAEQIGLCTDLPEIFLSWVHLFSWLHVEDGWGGT